MGILLAFAPFVVFALVDRLFGATPGLVAGAALSAGMLLRDWLSRGRAPKMLGIGTVILLGGLALYALFRGLPWSIIGVRLCVDLGLLVIVVLSIVLRRPFTLQYAREQVPAEHWGSPAFVRANYVITAVWCLAFAVLVIADLALLYIPRLPPLLGVAATVVALIAAIRFTGWYPDRLRAKAR
jgi:hypothetical protein